MTEQELVNEIFGDQSQRAQDFLVIPESASDNTKQLCQAVLQTLEKYRGKPIAYLQRITLGHKLQEAICSQ